METEVTAPFRPRSSKAAATSLLPEVDVFIHLLLLLRLLDSENLEKVCMIVCIDLYILTLKYGNKSQKQKAFNNEET